jgi:hypothetical protein
VQVIATREGVAPELLLASVIAHETGHLLGLAHEPLGLMEGHWSSREMPQLARAYLHFNRKQRERLQAEVLARMRSQQAMQNRNGPGTTSKTEVAEEELRQEIDDLRPSSRLCSEYVYWHSSSTINRPRPGRCRAIGEQAN